MKRAAAQEDALNDAPLCEAFPLQSRRAEACFAAVAARQAGLLVRRIQRDLAADAFAKSDRSPVTVADFAAQAVVAAMLGEAFPGEALVAEETATALRSSAHAAVAAKVAEYVRTVRPGVDDEAVLGWIDRGAAPAKGRFWVLDPIDGTKGFLRGGQYAVAFALVEGGKVQVGVLACPELALEGAPSGCLAVAVRGSGAWLGALDAPTTWQRLRVSTEANPARARVLRSFEDAHTNGAQIEAVMRALGSTAEPVRMDSQAKYAVLAAGGAEVYLRLPTADRPDYREKIWDQAAGALVVQEAGGTVTDLEGRPLDFSRGRRLEANRGVVATNGVLHAAVLNALRAVGV